MKKSLFWMCAVLGMMFTSCAEVDNGGNGGVVAPEDAPVIVDFENDDASMFTANKLKMEIVQDATEENGTKVAQFSYAGKGFCFAPYEFRALENATNVAIEFDFCVSEVAGQSAIVIGDAAVENLATGGFDTSNPQYGFGSNGAIFYLGGSRGKISGANQNYFWINGEPVATTLSEEGRKASDIWGKWFHAAFEIKPTQKTLSYVIANGEDVWYAGKDVAFVSEAANTCTQLAVFMGNTGTIKLDNISVTKEWSDEKIKYADYTINYVTEEGEAIGDLKPSETRRGLVGDSITLLAADTTNLQTTDGSIKYIYQKNTLAENAIITEEGTVVNVIFKKEEASTYQYIVNCYVEATGEAEGKSATDRLLARYTGKEFEGVKTYIRPSICYKWTNGKYYTVAPTGYNGYVYTVAGTETKTQGYIIGTVNYTLDESIVYFGEGEEIAKTNFSGTVTAPTTFSNAAFDRFSAGWGAKLAADATIWTDALPKGKYDVTIYGRNDKSAASNAHVLGIRTADGTVTELALEIADWGSAATGSMVYAGVEVPEGCSIVIICKGTATNVTIDSVTIKAAAE